jgi:leucyl aminopeptidase
MCSMKIVKRQSVKLESVEAIVVPVFKGKDIKPVYNLYPESEFYIGKYKFKGNPGQEVVFHAADDKKLTIIVGGGDPNLLLDTVKLSKKIVSILQHYKVHNAMVHLCQPIPLNRLFWLRFIDYLFISNYHFDTYLTEKKEAVKKIILKTDALNPPTRDFIKRRETIAECLNRVRHLVNEIPSKATPDFVVECFEKMAAENGLDITVWRREELKRRGLYGITSVGEGSPQEPALVHLSYKPPVYETSIALVGKGITFDSGGMNLKSAAGMLEMKSDMAGGAAVLGILEAAAQLALPVKIDAFVPVSENMPGHNAYKPGDIITFNNKKTVEIINTDSEGRLLLADALILAAQMKPSKLIELSTLTGSISNALGEGMAGLMCDNHRLTSHLEKSAHAVGERLCSLPMPEDYKDAVKSKIASLKNAGYGKASGIKTGLFLKEFAGGIPFAHIDIAGTAFISKARGFYSQDGATGFGVRLVLDFLESLLPRNSKKTLPERD